MGSYTVYLTRTDNGEIVSAERFDSYDTAHEFAEIWKNERLSYRIEEE